MIAKLRQRAHAFPVPEADPMISSTNAGRLQSRSRKLKLKLHSTPCPQVFFRRPLESFSAVKGDFFSITRIGTTKKLTATQEKSKNLTMSLPIRPSQASAKLSMTPTVAITSAQPAIKGKQAKAAWNPYAKVGASPCMRFAAEATTAELKKVMIR